MPWMANGLAIVMYQMYWLSIAMQDLPTVSFASQSSDHPNPKLQLLSLLIWICYIQRGLESVMRYNILHVNQLYPQTFGRQFLHLGFRVLSAHPSQTSCWRPFCSLSSYLCNTCKLQVNFTGFLHPWCGLQWSSFLTLGTGLIWDYVTQHPSVHLPLETHHDSVVEVTKVLPWWPIL